MTASNRKTLLARKQLNKGIAKENENFSAQLRKLSQEEIGELMSRGTPPVEVWRSNRFLVQVYECSESVERLSVCRTKVDPTTGRWVDKITWDDLQSLKRECGRGHFDAVEVYPSDKDIVNVANMRHLWVFKNTKIPFAWRSEV